MRGAMLLALSALAACFSPDYPDGLTCEPAGGCPPGQTCAADNRCYREISGDGGVSADAVMVDAGLGELLSIDIGPDVIISVVGTHVFAIQGIYENGTQPITDFAIWSSSNTTVMYVDFEGVAHGQATGSATATADYEGRRDTALVTVQ